MKDKQEILWKKVEEEIKVIADVERNVFAAFLATALATVNFTNRFAVGLGAMFTLILLSLYLVLVLIRQNKIKKYE